MRSALYAAAYRVEGDIVQSQNLWCYSILWRYDALLYGVESVSALQISYLEVKVRAKRRTAIARKGYGVALTYGEHLLGREECQAILFALVASLGEIVRYILAKAREVGIYRHCPLFWVVDVERESVARRRYRHTRDISVGNCNYRLTLHALGANIYARMEMVGAHFAKGGGVESLYPFYRVAVLLAKGGCSDNEQQCKYAISQNLHLNPL